MSWNYSGDPADSAKDLTRFLIGDTDSTDPLLQDEEINWVLGQYNMSAINASIRCCEAIMSKFGRLADEAVGQVKISYSQKAKAYRQIAADLKVRLATEDAAPYGGGLSQSDKITQEQNKDRVKPDFSKHQQENQQISPWVTSNRLGRGQEDD